MIIDEVKIEIKAGDGGNGGVYFRREKFIPKGGPDGGDGGNGGDIIFESSRHEHDLTQYARARKFTAENGVSGMPQKSSGKNGQDLILRVPIGTQIYRDDQLAIDLMTDNQQYNAAKGGNGGWGNQHFATSIKQAPKWAKQGLPGESDKLRLELKMIADVGLVGLPNAGKSTLLSVISNAKPRIADYPFTTLEPNLGVVRFADKSIVVADIPGLIEGASEGRGLGHKFLKHIERTRILVQLIDVSSDNPWRDYQTVSLELKNFSEKLAKKKKIVVLSKTEILTAPEIKNIIGIFKKHRINIVPISAATHTGVDELIYGIIKKIS